jgi:hypothetical protein
MNDLLAHHCLNAKTNKEEDFKRWLGEVKRIDDTMHAERCEFEEIAKVSPEAG